MANEQATIHYAPQTFYGSVTFVGPFYIPAGSIDNASIGANASNPIDAEKVEKEFVVTHVSDVDAAVAAFDEVVHIAQAAGEVVDVEIAVVTIPTGDNKITIDVQKWNGSTWASVLDATEDVDSGYTANTPAVITLDGSPTYVDGDLLRIIGVLGGSSGAHAQGLIVQVRLREKP